MQSVSLSDWKSRCWCNCFNLLPDKRAGLFVSFFDHHWRTGRDVKWHKKKKNKKQSAVETGILFWWQSDWQHCLCITWSSKREVLIHIFIKGVKLWSTVKKKKKWWPSEQTSHQLRAGQDEVLILRRAAGSNQYTLTQFLRRVPPCLLGSSFPLVQILACGNVNMEADSVVRTFISKRLLFQRVSRYEPCPCQLESKMPDLPVPLSLRDVKSAVDALYPFY